MISVPEPHVTVFTDCLFVVREGQRRLTQAAALQERLLVHLFLDVANQDLRRMTHTHTHTKPQGVKVKTNKTQLKKII